MTHLAARWELEDTGATVADLSGYGNVGTFVGGVTKDVAGAGVGSKAVEFDGSTGYVSFPASASLNGVVSQWALSAWIYPTASRSGPAGIISARYSTAVPFCLCYGPEATVGATDGVWAGIYNAGWYGIGDPTGTVSLNTWTHFVATWDGGTFRLYRNGALVNTVAAGAVSVAQALGVLVGRQWWDGSPVSGFFPGRIDDARIYLGTLTAAQVLALYNNGPGHAGWVDLGPVAAGFPVATSRWELEETSGNALDSVGSNHAGVVGGVTRGVAGARAGSNAYQFDGVNGYIGAAYTASLDSPTWTISAWVYPTAAATGISSAIGRDFVSSVIPYILTYGMTAGGAAASRRFAGAFYGPGGWSVATDPVDTPLNAWTHYIATYNGAVVCLYRNGVLVASTAASGVVSNAGNVYMSYAWTTNYFPGSLDDIRFFRTALNADQALALYQWSLTGTPPVEPGPLWISSQEPVAPVALWTLDDMDTTCRDSSGNGLHGTYQGSLSHAAAGPLGATASKCTEFGASGVTNSGQVVIPAYGALDLRGAWTVCIWLYATAYRNVPESLYCALMCHQWGPLQYYLYYGTQGGSGANQRICISQHTGSAVTNCPDTVDLPLNTWKHFVGTNDGAGTLRLYRDGVHVNSAGAYNGITPGPAFFIAADSYFATPSVNYFPGRLWRARIYNVALSADQVLGLYQRELAIAPWMPLGAVT